jgi:hypothetical protein
VKNIVIFRPMFFVLYLTFLAGLSLACAEDFIDPAAQITTFKLTTEDEKTCRENFQKLASDDFDTREKALARLISFGPAILPLANEYTKHADPEIASQAKSLNHKVLLIYDGYLSTSPELTAALAKKIEYSLNSRENMMATVRKIAADAGISLFIDPHVGGDIFPEVELQNEQELPVKGRALDAINSILRFSGEIVAVPRGNALVLTTAGTAQRLSIQRHTFDWGHLGLNRDEAERVALLLKPFFPGGVTEIHTGPEPFVIRGEEAAIRRAARILALLKPGAPDAIFSPTNILPPTDSAPLVELLSKNASLVLSAEDPLGALSQFKKQGLYVFCVNDGPDFEVRQEPPFSPNLRGASPLRLTLRDQPLGLILRWLERRSKFPAAEQSDLVLGYEIDSSSRLQFRLQNKVRPELSSYFCGADVTFLYPRGAKPGAESDAAAKAAFLEGIDSHLSLFPRYIASRDIAIVRGRMFMQGDYGTLARTLDLVREWRVRGAAPPTAAWKAALETRLSNPVEWDGRGIGAGNLLPTLRKLGQFSILLEDAADGRASNFKLSAKDAELLAPGKHTLRALLDNLASRADAAWRIDLGVIVITPAATKR